MDYQVYTQLIAALYTTCFVFRSNIKYKTLKMPEPGSEEKLRVVFIVNTKPEHKTISVSTSIERIIQVRIILLSLIYGVKLCYLRI